MQFATDWFEYPNISLTQCVNRINKIYLFDSAPRHNYFNMIRIYRLKTLWSNHSLLRYLENYYYRPPPETRHVSNYYLNTCREDQEHIFEASVEWKEYNTYLYLSLNLMNQQIPMYDLMDHRQNLFAVMKTKVSQTMSKYFNLGRTIYYLKLTKPSFTNITGSDSPEWGQRYIFIIKSIPLSRSAPKHIEIKIKYNRIQHIVTFYDYLVETVKIKGLNKYKDLTNLVEFYLNQHYIFPTGSVPRIKIISENANPVHILTESNNATDTQFNFTSNSVYFQLTIELIPL